MNKQLTNRTFPSFEHIPVYERFQWLNHPRVVDILSRFLRPPRRGRKGYDKVLMFRWLMYKQLMGCSYRDLESMTGIDHTTFIKFRKRLMEKVWFPHIFQRLTSTIAKHLPVITAILDSSFVETYSRHDEEGSEYSGYKEKNGFKLHQMIDYDTRLPILQTSTGGARADVILGQALIDRAPPHWKVKGLAADKGYDSEHFVHKIKMKWKKALIAIPTRRIPSRNTERSRQRRGLERTHNPQLYKKRTGIERYFSRKKRVFRLGEEKTRHLKNFRAHCYLTSLMEILEWASKSPLLHALFSRLHEQCLTS